MIRRLTLKNWRNYDDITVNFEAGTTFVVASNGVGKTSLVEAARWALFGAIGSGGNGAVRAGADSAQAAVELVLPDQRILTVERTLAAKPRRTEPPPVVHVDGALVSTEELDVQLVRAYGTEPSFLARLTMPAVGRDQDSPAALGLEEHLGRYYGVDGLRDAVAQLSALRKANDIRIKRIKEGNATSSQRLAQLQSDVDRTTSQAHAAAELHTELQKRLDRARERERFAAEVQKWQEEVAVWAESTDRLTERAARELMVSATRDSLAKVIGERLAQLDQEIEAVRVEAAVNAAREAALTANQERLDTAHDDCPVCRRPLDEATVTLAHDANERELVTIRESTERLKATELDRLAKREMVRNLRSEWDRIPTPHSRPDPVDDSDEEQVDSSQMAAMVEAALSALVEARASHVQSSRELDDARAADEAMRELESLFRQDATLRVAIEATESTLTELLDETIHPLAVEIDQRWRALFPDRGDLTTYSDGNITRTVNGHPLPYDSFSTGESMGATILLRLLVAQMATAADFCWFDEPLEHLDPDVRRKVANLLARATSGEGPLRQVVVTTYEEPLARHLQARDKQGVSLVDVRQST